MRYSALVLLALAAPASAQSVYDQSSQFLGMDAFTVGHKGKHEIAVTAGGFRPTSRFEYSYPGFTTDDEFGRTGYFVTLDFLRNVTPWAALGGEYFHVVREQREINNVYGAGAFFKTRVRGDTNGFIGIVRLRAPGLGFKPYAVGGAGWQRTRLNMYGAWPMGGPEIDFINDAKTSLVWMIRAGVEYAFASGGFAALEGGFLRTATMDFGPTPDGQANGFRQTNASASGITLGARLGARFGGSGY